MKIIIESFTKCDVGQANLSHLTLNCDLGPSHTAHPAHDGEHLCKVILKSCDK